MDKLKVYYSELQVADADQGYSPSAGKPRLLAEALLRAALPVEFVVPYPVTTEDFYRVHDRDYVDDVLACRRANGFGNRSPEVARSLPHTSGSFYAAAACALETGIAASLTSGFHHAGYEDGAGFCTFNGLMVAAARLFADNRVERLAIVDCDQHYGDGTADIMRRLDTSWIFHLTMGLRFGQGDGEAYLKRLRQLPPQLSDFQPDIILYQAGADCHVDDPLGGCLTTEQMEQRDRIVFEAARSLRIPLVFNQAGGYQRGPDGGISPVIQLHINTFKAAIDVYGIDTRP
jgi:acetoin utilization deacetylase AcuC-like enzyme